MFSWLKIPGKLRALADAIRTGDFKLIDAAVIDLAGVLGYSQLGADLVSAIDANARLYNRIRDLIYPTKMPLVWGSMGMEISLEDRIEDLAKECEAAGAVQGDDPDPKQFIPFPILIGLGQLALKLFELYRQRHAK